MTLEYFDWFLSAARLQVAMDDASAIRTRDFTTHRPGRYKAIGRPVQRCFSQFSFLGVYQFSAPSHGENAALHLRSLWDDVVFAVGTYIDDALPPGFRRDLMY